MSRIVLIRDPATGLLRQRVQAGRVVTGTTPGCCCQDKQPPQCFCPDGVTPIDPCCCEGTCGNAQFLRCIAPCQDCICGSTGLEIPSCCCIPINQVGSCRSQNQLGQQCYCGPCCSGSATCAIRPGSSMIATASGIATERVCAGPFPSTVTIRNTYAISQAGGSSTQTTCTPGSIFSVRTYNPASFGIRVQFSFNVQYVSAVSSTLSVNWNLINLDNNQAGFRVTGTATFPSACSGQYVANIGGTSQFQQNCQDGSTGPSLQLSGTITVNVNEYPPCFGGNPSGLRDTSPDGVANAASRIARGTDGAIAIPSSGCSSCGGGGNGGLLI